MSTTVVKQKKAVQTVDLKQEKIQLEDEHKCTKPIFKIEFPTMGNVWRRGQSIY